MEGWVEHDPDEIWQTTLAVSRDAVREAEAKGGKVVAIGITNQRETTIVWDRRTGKPLYNAIVWQDRRTADICDALKADGLEDQITSCTGLLLDPYFFRNQGRLDFRPCRRSKSTGGCRASRFRYSGLFLDLAPYRRGGACD